MKRTKVINKARFRKGFVLASVVATSFAITGCEVADETVKMYQTVDECATLESGSLEQCKASFASAKAEHEKSGPKFESASECSSEFGTCEYNQATSSFMPMMMGFMAGQMMGNMQANSNFRAAHASPMYKTSSGSYADIRKNTYSNIKPGQSFSTYKSTMKSQPSSTVQPRQATSTRGGFGKSMSSNSSRSSSFGG